MFEILHLLFLIVVRVAVGSCTNIMIRFEWSGTLQ
jgi:hypothetical protein